MDELERQSMKDADEINLVDLVKVIWKHRWLIIWLVAIAVVATAVVSLIMTPIYEAKAVITPSGPSAGGTASASLLAAQFGIAPPTTPIAAEIVNTLKSNTLREKIIKRYNLIPVLIEKRDPEEEKDEHKLIWKGIRALDGITKINLIQKDNIVEIRVQHKDPKMAKEIVNYTLNELNDHMSGEAKRVANTNKKYLESQVDKQSDPFIKAKIYALIAQQIETSMMAEVKENFAFKIIDHPMVPDKRIKPKRTMMVMIAFVTSLFLGIFAAFFKEYIDKMRNKM